MKVITIFTRCFLYIILCTLSKADVKTQRYIMEASLDNKMSNVSLLAIHHSESLTQCSTMCGQLCACFGFNPQLKKCRIHQSCDQADMTINETGWRNFYPYEYCDFEGDPESSCFLSESTADEFDWTCHTGPTKSVGTGPTSAASGQYYKYIETSKIGQHERALLETTKTFQDKTYCLTMYYHMYGATTESLLIQTKKVNDAHITRWQKSGNQGNSWYQLSGVNLTLDSQTKILIEATKGSSYTGDIAIDHVKLWPFACP